MTPETDQSRQARFRELIEERRRMETYRRLIQERQQAQPAAPQPFAPTGGEPGVITRRGPGGQAIGPARNPVGMPGAAPPSQPSPFIGQEPANPYGSGVLADVAIGLDRGVPVVRRQIGGALAGVGGALGLDSVEQAGRQEIDAATARLDQMAPTRTFAGQVAEAVPGFAAAIGAGALTGGAAGIALGAGVAGAQSGGGQFADARQRALDQGASEEDAAAIAGPQALATGAFSAITSTIPIARIVQGRFPGPMQAAASRVLGSLERTAAGRTALAAVSEGSQEASEQVFQGIVQAMAEDTGIDPGQLLRDAALAAAAGGVLGAGARGGIELAGRRQEAPNVQATPEGQAPPQEAPAAPAPDPVPDPVVPRAVDRGNADPAAAPEVLAGVRPVVEPQGAPDGAQPGDVANPSGGGRAGEPELTDAEVEALLETVTLDDASPAAEATGDQVQSATQNPAPEPQNADFGLSRRNLATDDQAQQPAQQEAPQPEIPAQQTQQEAPPATPNVAPAATPATPAVADVATMTRDQLKAEAAALGVPATGTNTVLRQRVKVGRERAGMAYTPFTSRLKPEIVSFENRAERKAGREVRLAREALRDQIAARARLQARVESPVVRARLEANTARTSETLETLSQNVKVQVNSLREVRRRLVAEASRLRNRVATTENMLNRRNAQMDAARDAREAIAAIAENMPAAIRGKLTTALRDAKNAKDVYAATGTAAAELVRYRARVASNRIRKLTGKRALNKLDTDTRRKIADAMGTGEESFDRLRALARSPLSPDARGPAVEALEQMASTIETLVAEYNASVRLERLDRALDVNAARSRIIDAVGKRKELPLDNQGKVNQPGLVRRWGVANMDAGTVAMLVDGSPDGEAARLMRQIRDARNRAEDLRRDRNRIIDAAARGAGYERGMTEIMAARSGTLGEALVQPVRVRLGSDMVTITPGQLDFIYSSLQDVNTRASLLAGQPIRFERKGRDYRLAMRDVDEIARMIDPKVKAAIDAVKQARTDLMQGVLPVVRTLKGYEPPMVEGYERRIPDRDKGKVEIDWQDPGGQAAYHLENMGLTKARVDDTKTPLLMVDFWQNYLETTDNQIDLQTLALPVHEARRVLESDAVQSAINSRLGRGVSERFESIIRRAAQPIQFGRIGQAVSNVSDFLSRSGVIINPRTWLIQPTSALRFGGFTDRGSFLAGLRGMATQSMDEILAASPLARSRYLSTQSALASGYITPEQALTTPRVGFAEQARQTQLGLEAAAKSLASGNLREALRGVDLILNQIRVLNFFDSFALRAGWGIAKAEAAKGGHDQAWTVRRFEQLIETTQGSGDPMDQTGVTTGLAESGLKFLSIYRNDPNKVMNMLARAQMMGRTPRALGFHAASAATAAVIVGVFKGILSDDEEKQADGIEAAAVRLAQELFPGPIAGLVTDAGASFVATGNATPGNMLVELVPTLVRATTKVGRGVYAWANEDNSELSDEGRAKAWDGTLELIGGLSAARGIPLNTVIRPIRRAMREEDAITTARQEFMQAQGIPDSSERREVSETRATLYDALARGDAEAVRRAVQALRDAGQRVSRGAVQEIIEDRDPVKRATQGMTPRQAREFRRSLTGRAKEALEREQERHRRALANVPMVFGQQVASGR